MIKLLIQKSFVTQSEQGYPQSFEKIYEHLNTRDFRKTNKNWNTNETR